MPDYRENYGDGTIRIINGLDRREYSTVDELKDALRECRLYSFAGEFWLLTMARFPCRICEALLEECEKLRASGKSLEKAGSVLPLTKRKLWHEYCASAGTSDPEKLVSGFLGKTCRSSPLCRPCACKDSLIKFFAQTSGASADTVKKNINNWLSGHSTPGSRESCIQLCYALGLRIPGGASIPPALNANRFLSMVCGQNPLYTRDRAELVHYYCLMRPEGKALGFDKEYDRVKNYRYALELIQKAKDHKGGAAYGCYTGEARLMIDGAADENDLLDLVASCTESDDDRYYSARTMLTSFFELYRDLYDSETGSKKSGTGKKERKPSKELSLKVIDILSEAKTDKASTELLRRFVGEGFTLSDALYRSGLAGDMSKGTVPVTRSVIMLALLSLNYGVKYDVKAGDLIETGDLVDDDDPGTADEPEAGSSFNKFCGKISEVLDSCGLAPLYPRRRFDYLVLYSYRRLTADRDRRGRADSLSDYLISSLEVIGENEEES